MKYADIFWADLPDRGGREQRGRRPVVIWQDTTAFSLPTVLVIPLTSNNSTLRFPGTLSIQASAMNGLSHASVALVFQLGACDMQRLRTRVGELEPADLTRLQDLAKRMQRLP